MAAEGPAVSFEGGGGGSRCVMRRFLSVRVYRHHSLAPQYRLPISAAEASLVPSSSAVFTVLVVA
jgi:hypothetical protein